MPLSDNGYYPIVKGRKILSKKGREYKKLVWATIKPKYKLIGRVIMNVTLHHSAKYNFDITNYMKCLCDALTDIGAYEDDSQIDKITIYRGAVEKNNGYVEVELIEVEGDKFDAKYLESLKEK